MADFCTPFQLLKLRATLETLFTVICVKQEFLYPDVPGERNSAMNWKAPLVLGALAVVLSGCGSSTSAPPPPPAIVVAFSPAAPATVAIGMAAQITATVSNDSAAKGVNWSCTPVNSCGSFNPTATASGVATAYVAPPTVPAGAQVAIIATAVSDATKNATANVHISGIAVNFTTPPPSVIAQGTTANPVATVANDAALAGVNWSCTPTGACGSFNPSTTQSGASTTYTPPSKGTPNIIITATSVTDPKASAGGAVIVPGIASLGSLKGQYAFLIHANVGNQTTRGYTTFIGSVTLDGAGNVTGGMEDIVSPIYYDQGDPICPTLTAGPCSAPTPTSFYKVDANGHGILQIRTLNQETLDFSFVVTSPSHAEIIETAGDPGSGTLDLQTTKTGVAGGFDVSQISGNYALILDGVNAAPSPTHRLSLGGVFQADGTGNISNSTLDVNDNGVFSTTGPGLGGKISIVPDANGRGQLQFNNGKSLRFYIVSNKVLRLFEDDNIDYMGGSAYAQGAGTPPQAGTFVYQHSGWNSSGTVRTVAAGQFTANAAGAITSGVSDSNAGGAPTIPSIGKAVSGSYKPTASPATLTMTDASGGPATFNVYPVDPTLNILDPNNSSNGGGALLLHTDANIVGSGVLLPQNLAASSNILGINALNLENAIAASSPREAALVGVVTSDGISTFANGLSDYDWDDANSPLFTVMLGAPFTGVYAADASNAGHFTGTFNIPTPPVNPPALTTTYPFILPSTNILNVSFYQASGAHAFVIQTDSTANVSGVLLQQQLP